MSNKSKNREVKVFSTPSCPWCAVAKKYLHEINIEFEDIDVSHDPNMAQVMIMKSGQMGVPQLWIDDSVVVGFDKQKINTLLGL